MAIAGIARSFAGRALKLRLPFRRRSKPKTEDPSPETTIHGGGGLNSSPSSKEDEFRQVFRYFDANDDGKISAEELSAYFASTGDSVSLEEAEKIIREFSNDGAAVGEEESLLLEFEEFVRMMELRDAEDDKVLRQAFEVYVVEKGGGCITPEGLRQVLRRLGDVKSHQECEAMIRVFDLDGNGVLDFHEFHKMMMS
ncbi:putative calcium-binding protein CML41 [Sesamum alatum]|uniref:Calcium-binding protein CML41 n=1 Tax=Sesamum alatum TaxID=300844 RepID=A0AAE1YFC9_9LAMI|nr:putative calcium-binding protein CML41 [Sesamum alatum]